MTAPSPADPPELDQAKEWLEHGLCRVIAGAQKVVIVMAIVLAISQIVPTIRYVISGLTSVSDVLPGLVIDLCGVALIFLVVRCSLPKVLRTRYQPLLERGRVVPVKIQLAPHGLHHRFTGQSTQPFMIRGAVEGVEILFSGWLPTRPVNFRRVSGHQQLRTGFLYSDERLTWDDPAYAMVDPRNPKKIWLVRQPAESSS